MNLNQKKIKQEIENATDSLTTIGGQVGGRKGGKRCSHSSGDCRILPPGFSLLSMPPPQPPRADMNYIPSYKILEVFLTDTYIKYFLLDVYLRTDEQKIAAYWQENLNKLISPTCRKNFNNLEKMACLIVVCPDKAEETE